MISARTTRSRRWRWLVGGVATLTTVLAVASCATSTIVYLGSTPSYLSHGDVSDFMSIPCKPQGEMKENAMDKLQTFELFTACYFLGLDLDSDMKWKMVRIELRVTRPGYLHSIAPAISRVNHLGTAEAADRSASTSKSASPPQRRQFPLLRK